MGADMATLGFIVPLFGAEKNRLDILFCVHFTYDKSLAIRIEKQIVIGRAGATGSILKRHEKIATTSRAC